MNNGNDLNQQKQSEINKSLKSPNFTCKSKMLQSILDMKNIQCESKDDYYNDIISFERFWNEWDHDSILLSSWRWVRRDKDSYVYIEPLAVYTDISIFARAMQFLLPHDSDIRVYFDGDYLRFTIYDNDQFTSSVEYEAKYMDVNQRNPRKHVDGWKFNIDNLKEVK